MSREFELMYIGAFAPDREEYENAATSRAAFLFQTSFLEAIVGSDLPTPTVRAYFPVASYPKVKQLFHTPRTERLDCGLEVRSLAHFNFGPLKVLTLGLSAAWSALWWGLKRRGRTCVVVTYNLNAPPAFLLVPVCRVLGMRFVPFIGDIYVPGDAVPYSWTRRLEFALQKWAISQTDGLLVCNEAIIEDFAPSREHLLVEGGVPESLRARFKSEPGAHDGRFHVVFAGQLSELNGVRLLLDALRICDMQDLRVSILGSGALTAVVRQAVARDPRVSFLGLVPFDEVLDIYGTADLLLNLRDTSYVTHRYVFPSKVIECLATGVPLLSTRTGHVEEEFGSFVYLLHDETPQALAKLIEFVAGLDPAARKDTGKRAQDYVFEHKTWAAHVNTLRKYLDDAVLGTKEAA